MSDKSNNLVDSEDLKVSLPWVPTTETDKDNNNSSESHNGQTTSQSLQDSCKSDDSSEDSHGFILEAQQDFLIKAKIKKNISLQNILCTQRASSCGDMVQEDAYMKYSIHNIDQINNIGKIHLDDYYMDNVSRIQNQNHGSTNPEFHEISFVEPINHQSIFSIEAAEQYDADHLEYADNESAKHGPYAQMSSDSQPLNAKSCYLSGLRGESIGNCDGVLKPKIMGSDSTSFENMFLNNVKSGQYVECNEATYSMVKLNWKNTSFGSNDRLHEYNLDERSLTCHSELREDHLVSDHSCKFNKEIDSEKDGKYVIRKSSSEYLLVDRKGLPCDEDSRKMCHRSEFSVGYDDMGDQERDDKSLSGKQKCDIAAVNGNDSDNCVSAVKLQHISGLRLKLKETSVENWHGTPIEEPNSNRIDAWISQLDVQNCNVLEELGGRSNCISNKDSSKEAGKNIRKKLDASSLGMVAAYNYISALSPASSMAHMANLGLVVIPYLSAFAGLKMLDLSGNAIVRITSGVIPKGLQMLNLSKNNISVIEGLRELTRLRVMDLSHNKISRIGHGLASCSSLKELYLAGNKISEVEGLHRLLKLSILDLRSNKISASQSFRQLVANYASLQAINLEANPAQKNVGDEQLKKYVLSLLPRLAYYNNKEVNRASGSKEALSRPSRSFSSHQSDKSFNRESHRGSRISGYKSMHGYMKSDSKVNSSIKSSRSTYKALVPLASKPTDHLPHTSRNARGPHSMRRIHSEGAF